MVYVSSNKKGLKGISEAKPARTQRPMPHRTVVGQEERQIEVLNQALKEAIIKELRG